MKKLIFIAMLLVTNLGLASETPGYLKDGIITVTLKNGKSYSFSTNEYMVVKRGAAKTELAKEEKPLAAPVVVRQSTSSNSKRLKHIVSGEVLRSTQGFDTKVSGNQTDVTERKKIGVGVQYQYNFYKDLFMGGRVDTNGGAGVSLGLGF